MTEQGILTIAQNGTVDYLRLAYLQRLSLRRTNPGLPYAVVVDQATNRDMSDSVRQVFDHVVVLGVDLAEDQAWKQNNECQLFHLTPFRETIKVESDLLFVTDINAWWPLLRHRDVVISSGCVDYRGVTATARNYREAFDINSLPDVYTGLMYWRRSQTAMRLFNIARSIYTNWTEVRRSLRLVDTVSTDMVFAIAANIIGRELVTLPCESFRMAHLKSAICHLPGAWANYLPWEIDQRGHMRIGGFQQWYPVHYHDKDWADLALEEYTDV